MGALAKGEDPLIGGFYTVSDAMRLLGVDNRQRIYRWLSPGAGKVSEPVIQRDYAPVTNMQELSFWDLIEVRFVEHFRGQNVSLQFLRKVAAKMRKELRVKHPFALYNAKFMTDRKRIFAQTAEEEHERTFDFLSGQYEMYDVIENILAKNISFDPRTALAMEWRPLANDCPHVVVNPRYAYGQPVIGERHVPVAAIVRQWRANKGDRLRVADWYGVYAHEVDEAIEFEVRIAA